MNRAKGIAEATTSSADDIPIACSLSATDLGGREVEWRALLDTPLVKAERIPSGVRLTVQPGGTAELQRLIDLERTCCAWMEFEFDSPETVAITASAAGVEVLVAMFLDRDATGRSPRPPSQPTSPKF
jgi:hypothetical protein